MRRFLFFILPFLGYVLPAFPEKHDLKVLYAKLDSLIAYSPNNIAAKEKNISDLKASLDKEGSLAKRYDILERLYKEYEPYCNDSAISYITRCMDVAGKMNDQRKYTLAKITLAYQCSKTGMYTEAGDLLDGMDLTDCKDSLLLGKYYMAYVHMYGEIAYYCKVQSMKRHYYDKQDEYTAKMLAVLDDDSEDCLMRKEIMCYAGNNFDEAIAINDKRMKLCDENSHTFAIVAFYRFLDYKHKGDIEEQKYWLLRSAIVDASLAIMDQGSMWELSNLLFTEGDYDRAYEYINFAWDCAVRFGARVRSWQVAPVLSTLDRLHQEESDLHNKLLIALGGVAILLGVVLFVMLVFVNRQRKKLADSHKELNDTYMKLSAYNDNLSKLYEKLQDSNGQLSKQSRDLQETNKVKEEYIGRFLSLCAQYVDRLEDFRKRIYKLVKNKDTDRMLATLRSSEFLDKDLTELYVNFDMAFLHLFPNFIEDFNALLKPEKRIDVKQGQALPTVVRIFALIRLGITDSSKIARFLHYSVNTIYNYRARVKNDALDTRENFEACVMGIGK